MLTVYTLYIYVSSIVIFAKDGMEEAKKGQKSFIPATPTAFLCMVSKGFD